MANCGEVAEEGPPTAAAAAAEPGAYIRRSPSPRPTPHSPVVKRFIVTQASQTQTNGLHPLVLLRAASCSPSCEDNNGSKG